MNDRARSGHDSHLPALPLPRGTRAIVRIDAAASWQPVGCSPGPVSLLVDNMSPDRLVILAHATPNEVDHHPAAGHALRIDLRGHVLLPGLINAHAHLDLTHLGPMPWAPGQPFTEWVAHIRAGRRVDPESIAESVRWGAELAIAGGTVAVGDIAGAVRGRISLAAAEALAPSGLHGVSFLEFFAVGPRAGEYLELVEVAVRGRDPALAAGRLRLGLQPHATNTVQPSGYLAAIRMAARGGLGLCTHLAETLEERDLIGTARGPQRALLEQVGAWDDTLLSVFGQGRHPVAHLQPVLQAAADAGLPMLVAHVNDATDEAIEILAQTRTRVVYCPRASAYFGAERRFGPHRYREMLDAGITVCLGTDSVVNITDGTLVAEQQSAGGGKPTGRLSVLDEMRFLWRRDRTDPDILIQMGTSNPVRALQSPWLGDDHVGLGVGRSPLAILGVPTGGTQNGPSAVHAALERSDPPIFILTRILPVWQQ